MFTASKTSSFTTSSLCRFLTELVDAPADLPVGSLGVLTADDYAMLVPSRGLPAISPQTLDAVLSEGSGGAGTPAVRAGRRYDHLW